MLSLLRKRSRSTVALDVGSSVVKCLRIDHSGEAPLITHFAKVELLPEAIVEGEVMDRDIVVEAIRECLSRAGIDQREVVVAVGGRSVIVKKIIMDKMTAADAQEAILWEAEQHVPFDIDDISLDFQIVKDDVGANQMEILLVAAKKETIATHAELVREAGLVPVVVDVDAFAMQNAWEASCGGKSDDVVALLNIGADTTNVCIVQQGVPYFTRDLPVGTNRLVEGAQREFGLDLEEARELVAHWEADEEITADQLVGLAEEVVEDLSTGIERSLSFLRTSGDAEAIDRVVLSGGGSRFPGLAQQLASRHDLDVTVGDPLEGIDYDPEIFGEDGAEAIAPMLAVSVGLGIRSRGDK